MSLPVILLVLAPALAAVAALVVPARRAASAASIGAAITALLAIVVAVEHRAGGARATLRAELVAKDGPLARALDAAGLDEPVARAEVAALVVDGFDSDRPDSDQDVSERRAPEMPERERLERLAGVTAARATLGWLLADPAPDPGRVMAARAALAEAEAAQVDLTRRLEAVREATRRVATLALGREAKRFSHVSRLRWLPAAGAELLIGVDDVSSALAVALAVIALAALLAAPVHDPSAPRERRRVGAPFASPATLALVLTGLALAEACVLALDLVVLSGAWALSAAAAWAVCGVSSGHGVTARAARSFALRAACGAAALLAAAIAFPGTDDGASMPALVVAAHMGRIGLEHQEGLVLAALVACALRLPLLAPPGVDGDRGTGPVASWLAAWLWGSALPVALWPVVRATLLAPALASSSGAAGVAALLGGLIAVAGGLVAWRAVHDHDRLAATAVACVGLAVVGLAGEPGSSAAPGLLALAGGIGLAMAALGAPGTSPLALALGASASGTTAPSNTPSASAPSAPSTTAPSTTASASATASAPSTTAPSNTPSTTAPSTNTPSTTAPSTTASAPSTAAPSTTAPGTAAPSTAAPSTTAPSTAPEATGTEADVWVRRLAALGLVTAVGAPGTVGFAALVLTCRGALRAEHLPAGVGVIAVVGALGGALAVAAAAVAALRVPPAPPPPSAGEARVLVPDDLSALLVSLALLGCLALALGVLPWLVLPTA